MGDFLPIFCSSVCGIYYLFHCCLFGGSCIREKYMNNDCTGFFRKKYNKYYEIDFDHELIE
jgi:hypothetical protein